uniref:inorganic diphosphatase n=1 Tax=Arcella intermedia TaxID=1963864 RepID=A0A6B2LGD8_9EUKA
MRTVKYSPYLWNYGALPATWEDPEVVHPETGFRGDGDPIDVLEIGKFTHKPGDIIRVKVLGALGLIDEGEMDWKILAIDIRDPTAQFINGPADVLSLKKGCIEGIRDFFINYKVPDGKAKNVLAWDGEVKDRAYAERVIEECHQSYKKLAK